MKLKIVNVVFETKQNIGEKKTSYRVNSLFLYNNVIVTHITTFPIILFLFQINKENLYFIYSYAFPYSIIQNNYFSLILF